MIIIIKKKLIYIFCIILLTIFFASITVYTYINHSLNNIIVIDAGHGGVDGGATIGEIAEKNINLSIAKKLKDKLQNQGYNVVMTRENDISLDGINKVVKGRHAKDLKTRTKIINNSGAQLFLSIHVNCAIKNPKTNGSIVIYNDKFPQNKILAYSIQNSLNKILISEERTAHIPIESSFFILNNSKVPGVIIELAFLSNAKDRELLLSDEFGNKIAESIAVGVNQFIKQ